MFILLDLEADSLQLRTERDDNRAFMIKVQSAGECRTKVANGERFSMSPQNNIHYTFHLYI
jgi:hypothetical protein